MISNSRMKLRRCHGARSRLSLLALLGIFLSTGAGAADPLWWSQGSPRPVKTSGSEPLAVANVGQARYLAKCAYDALHLRNPVVAQAVLADLVGPGKPITSWTPPAPGTANAKEQYSPLLLGQLKAIARPFYNHLNIASSSWVLSQIQLNHNQQAVEETHYWQFSGNSHYTPNGYYPWNPATPAAANNAPVTIGQLKAIFALRFETLSSTDFDQDGIPDSIELTLTYRKANGQWGIFNPADPDTDDNGIPDGNEDYDHDGLKTLEEIAIGTNPNLLDTDGDRLPDGWEDHYDLDPLDASGNNGAAGDTDPNPAEPPNPGDGLLHFLEFVNKTNPNNWDSDGDGTSDLDEINQGSNPNDPSDGGQPPTDRVVEIPFNLFGDYASWEMTIKALGPRDNRELLVTTPGIDQHENKTLKLWRNNKYKVTLRHTGTKPNELETWFCWQALAEGHPYDQTFANYSLQRTEGVSEFFTLADGHFIVDNRSGLFTQHNDRRTGANGGGNVAEGLEAFNVPVGIRDNITATGVDDISITANPTDIGYQENFWIMAPAGVVPPGYVNSGTDCSNDMKLKIPMAAPAPLAITFDEDPPDPTTPDPAFPNPSTVALDGTGPSTDWTEPLVNWKGTPASPSDVIPKWKIGQIQEPVELPILVKAMKKRTVRVAIYPARCPTGAGNPPNRQVPVPDLSLIIDTLNGVFGAQVNAWFEVEIKPETNGFDYDPEKDSKVFTLLPPLNGSSTMTDFRDHNYDIHILLIDSVEMSEIPGSSNLGGYSYPKTFAIINIGTSTPPRQMAGVARDIAHEVGHLMFGKGHPDDPAFPGIAPLIGTNPSNRLMYSAGGANTKLLVKTEWDSAESWLIEHVDEPD